MRPLLLLALAAASAPLLAAPALTVGAPAQFDARWQAVIPRDAGSPYPHVGADWTPLPNPRYQVPTDRPLEGLRICVDAGHGGQVWGPTRGYTGGTRGVTSGLTESDANLRTAIFLWDLLTRAGAEVTMTRIGPDRLTPPAPEGEGARAELHARVEVAEQASADYFVSIHHNAPGPNAARLTNYTSVYYFDTSHYSEEYNADPQYVRRFPNEELNEERWQLALAIQSALVRRLDLPAIRLPEDWAQHFGHGVPHGDFHVIREINVPAVLAEASFMTHPDEDRRLNDPARAKQEALAIFEGILEHFENHPLRRWAEIPPAGPHAAPPAADR